MPSECCFWCPASDSNERYPGEKCPTCEREYDFPVRFPPAEIDRYQIIQPIARGFYGATYRAEHPTLQQTVVLKVVPKAIYELFGKDWDLECQEHARLAAGSPFVAGIQDVLNADVDFAGSPIPCHVAVLENIDGPTLQDVLASPDVNRLTPRRAAQIALDLFSIFEVFQRGGRFHNDLHAGNLLVRDLSQQQYRPAALDPSVRVVAIDLGSMKGRSASGPDRLGDQRQIAEHIGRLSSAVLTSASQMGADYRIAGALRGLSEHMAAPGVQRLFTSEDAETMLRAGISAAVEPWRRPLSLHRFGEAYNAQALESWYVPDLWFDPDGSWFARTTTRGPQVITGMRGCGKTMLLRALHFHARAAQAEKVNSTDPLAELEDEPFIGVFASCIRLLAPVSSTSAPSQSDPEKPFERLYVAYLRDLVQVLRHLRSLDPSALVDSIHAVVAPALEPLVLNRGAPNSEAELDQILLELQFGLGDGTSGCRLRGSAADAFATLAGTIRQASPAFAGKYVLFLLDDVSTRYVSSELVREVISGLLFQHPECAFKITTEAQALHRVLHSPGGSTPADPNRDYQEFDLGREVYSLLKSGSMTEKTQFVSEVLRRRGLQFGDAIYQMPPESVLGNVELKRIATEIANSSATSSARKEVYRGLRALQAVCVGDLGDIVKLYEKILDRADPQNLPVPAKDQCDCFFDHSAALLHFLNRRDERKKSLALAFAGAASELLVRSVAEGSAHPRLRQYTKLYVRVEPGPEHDRVADELFDLMDAGVFVYDGGVARTKTRDNDPVLQFKLTFRKMLGLSSYIGLSNRDRFELSGEKLRRWLFEPESSRAILLESEAQRSVEEEPEVEEPLHSTPLSTQPSIVEQGNLLLSYQNPAARVRVPAPQLGIASEDWSLEALSHLHGATLILGAGFEERASASAHRVLSALSPARVVVVQYAADQGAEVAHAVRRVDEAATVRSPDELRSAISRFDAPVVVDISGLAKPYLFVATQAALRECKEVCIVHTAAQDYYPTNEDLRILTEASEAQDASVLATGVGSVLMGEVGPYELVSVAHAASASDRWRTLVASASPKNDRLLRLLDERDYDAIRVLVPDGSDPRAQVAREAARFAASVAGANVGLVAVGSDDLLSAVHALEEIYGDHFFNSGADVEFGLTGSKLHAVAMAAISAAAEVSATWYVEPKEFDKARFTAGVGDTRVYSLRIEER